MKLKPGYYAMYNFNYLIIVYPEGTAWSASCVFNDEYEYETLEELIQDFSGFITKPIYLGAL